MASYRRAVKKLKQTLKNIKWLNIAQIAAVFGFAFFAVVAPQITHAQEVQKFLNNCPSGTGVRCGSADIASIFKLVINWALAISFIAAVIVLIYGGFQYITSAGNADGAKNGKQAVFNALIGIVIIVLSYLIVQIVFGFVSGSGGGSGGLIGQ
jgi:hypothetical protein